MPNFLKLNSKSDFPIKVEGNLLYGRVGYSITHSSLDAFSSSLAPFLLSHAYEYVHIGSDGSYWASKFLEETVIPCLERLGALIKTTPDPCTADQLCWLASQTKKKTFTLYLCKGAGTENFLSLQMFGATSAPLDPKEIKQLLKYPHPIKTEVYNQLINSSVESLDLSLYLKYLYDFKHLDIVAHPTTLHLDCMFGCFQVLGDLLKKLPNLNLKMYNLISEPPRINNYISKPTGSALKWYTTFREVNALDTYIAISGDGSSIGVYDLKQKTEISASSLALLYIKYLSKVKKVPNLKVLYSPVCSKRISDLCKKFKIKHKEVYEGFTSVKEEKEKDKESYIFYTDGMGMFYFNSPVCWSNSLQAIITLINCCSSPDGTIKISPGEQIDSIYQFDLKRVYKNASVFILEEVLDRATLKAELKLTGYLPIKDIGTFSIFQSPTLVDIVIKDNVIEGIVEVFIESKDESLIKKAAEDLGTIIKKHAALA